MKGYFYTSLVLFLTSAFTVLSRARDRFNPDLCITHCDLFFRALFLLAFPKNQASPPINSNQLGNLFGHKFFECFWLLRLFYIDFNFSHNFIENKGPFEKIARRMPLSNGYHSRKPFREGSL